MLRTLGFLFLALIAAAGMALGIWYYQDRQARQFVVDVTPLVFRDWNAQALARRSASLLQTPEYAAEVGDMFKAFRPVLGPLVSASTPTGTLQFGRADRGLPRGLYGRYTSYAKFSEADGQLEFLVIKEHGAWRIARFSVSSPALLEHLQRLPSVKAAKETWLPGTADDQRSVLAEAEEVFRLLDSEDSGSAWRRGSINFQQAMPRRRFVADMTRLRESTGHAQGRKLQGIGFMLDRANATPPGDYAIADFVTTYSRATLQERLGFYRHGDSWEFSAYHWNRMAESK